MCFRNTLICLLECCLVLTLGAAGMINLRNDLKRQKIETNMDVIQNHFLLLFLYFLFFLSTQYFCSSFLYSSFTFKLRKRWRANLKCHKLFYTVRSDDTYNILAKHNVSIICCNDIIWCEWPGSAGGRTTVFLLKLLISAWKPTVSSDRPSWRFTIETGLMWKHV